MENAIQNSSFESSNVRIIVEEGEPLFCASDVCKTLGYSNARDAMRVHCAEKGVVKRDTPTSGGVQAMAYIDERNLYRLIMRSKLPSAEKFQDWVCGEVLPSIRKTGKYATKNAEVDAILAMSKSELLLMAAETQKKNEVLEAKNLQLENKIEEDAPKVEFADGVIATGKCLCLREAIKACGVKPMAGFDWLRSHKFIYKQGNQATQKSIDMGLMVVRFANVPHVEGVEQKPYAHVTGKGLVYFRKKFVEAGLVLSNPNLEMRI